MTGLADTNGKSVHMPSCVHVLFRVVCLLHSNRGCEGTVRWGMFPRGCEDTVARSPLLCKGAGGIILPVCAHCVSSRTPWWQNSQPWSQHNNVPCPIPIALARQGVPTHYTKLLKGYEQTGSRSCLTTEFNNQCPWHFSCSPQSNTSLNKVW